VPFLLNLLPQRGNDQERYIAWLDNLFTSVPLLTELWHAGYGATGTARINSGITQALVDRKKEDKKRDRIEWGNIVQVPSINNRIVQSAWKDNAIVLMLSTTHPPLDCTISGPEMDRQDQSIIRKRKRPKETSSAARTARKPFGNSSTKDLRIPKVYDDYNYNMGGVDIADQLRGGMGGFRRIRRGGWRALWHFLLNLTLVNSFLLSGFKSQFEFRNALIRQLLEKGSESISPSISGSRKRKRSSLSEEKQARPNSERQHHGNGHKLGYRGILQRCTQCKEPPERRPILSEKSSNIQGRKVVGKTLKKVMYKRSRYGCIVCNIALCKEGNCFDLHVDSL
jgi:hypothetical protein